LDQPRQALHDAEHDLPTAHAHVGYARRLLMDEAARRLSSLGRSCGVIASTDADTRVGRTWVAETLAAVHRGADVVGGRILVAPHELREMGHSVRRLHLQDVTYRWLATQLDSRIDPDPADPWPRHFQHFGASVAVTVDAYHRAGGMPIQPWLEDVAFARELARADCRFRHSPRVRVITSGRRTGRTGFGYAAQLGIWEETERCGMPVLVESAEAIIARARARRWLRSLWNGGVGSALPRVAADLAISPARLAAHLREQPTFGALIATLGVPRVSTGLADERWPLVEIDRAISQLRRIVATRSGESVPALFEHVESPGWRAAAG
jgi:hypothetical protein